MAEKEYISKTAFLEQKRKQYCEDCDRRKGMKNGKYKTLYEIGDAPCRACSVNDILDDVEDFPAADVEPVRHGRWVWDDNGMDWGLGAWVCSVCHHKPETWWEADKGISPYRCSGSHYCPNCGKKMDGGADNG